MGNTLPFIVYLIYKNFRVVCLNFPICHTPRHKLESNIAPWPLAFFHEQCPTFSALWKTLLDPFPQECTTDYRSFTLSSFALLIHLALEN